MYRIVVPCQVISRIFIWPAISTGGARTGPQRGIDVDAAGCRWPARISACLSLAPAGAPWRAARRAASDPAGRGHGLGGRLAVGGLGEAGAFEVVHVDVGGLGGAGGGVQRRDELRPPLVVGEQRVQLGLQVGRWVAGDEPGRQGGPPDQPAAAGAGGLGIALGFLVDVPGDARRREARVPVRDQEVDDRGVIAGEHAGCSRAIRDRAGSRGGTGRAGGGGADRARRGAARWRGWPARVMGGPVRGGAGLPGGRPGAPGTPGARGGGGGGPGGGEDVRRSRTGGPAAGAPTTATAGAALPAALATLCVVEGAECRPLLLTFRLLACAAELTDLPYAGTAPGYWAHCASRQA